jgi:hypothetical protein
MPQRFLIALVSGAPSQQIPAVTRSLKDTKLLASVRAHDMKSFPPKDAKVTTFGRVLAKLIKDEDTHKGAVVQIRDNSTAPERSSLLRPQPKAR